MKTTVRTKIMTILGTVAAAGTLAGGIAATAPLAHADTGSGPRAITAANLRIGPSTHVGIRAVVQAGDPVAIACVSPGTAVDDNRDWFALTDQKGWISATLVEGAGEVEPCHGGLTGPKAITSADVNVRRGPSTLDESVGVLDRGTTVTVVCGAKGEVIDDAHRWFLLAGGNWVTGAYLPSVPPEDTPDCDA